MKITNLFAGILFTLFGTQTLAGDLQILPAGPNCQASKSDLDCLNKGQSSLTDFGKTQEVLLLSSVDVRSNGEVKQVGPVIRLTYKVKNEAPTEIFITSESSRKFGITMMELMDALRDKTTKVAIRTTEEGKMVFGVVLAIIK